MSISLDKKLLVSSLLPKSLINALQTEEGEGKLVEQEICATALLIVNTALGAIKVLEQGDYKRLDANPGDSGCQSRALELRRLIMTDLKEERSELKKAAMEIKKLVNLRNGSPKEQAKCTAQVFFKDHLGSLTVSNAMEYILHCYFSAVLRTPYKTLQNGVVMTKSELSKLSVLSGKINLLLDIEHRRKIVEENQKTLSMLSVAASHFSASQAFSLESEEKELMMTMLSPEHTHIFTPDVKKYEPKTFGCLFYEVKTVLVRLREEQGIVCLKNVVAKGDKPFHLLFQSKAPGEEFEVLPDEACTSLLPKTAVVVFEAVVDVEKETASKLFMEHGFTNTMLVQAAKEVPYEPTSSLADVKVPKAVEEISAFKEKSAKIGDFITLDHVYLNTLDAVLKK